MTLSGAGRRLSMVLRRASVLYGSQRHLGHLDQFAGLARVPYCEGPWPRSYSTSRFGKGNYLACEPVYSLMVRVHFSSEANEETAALTETVEEVYTKLLKSVEAKTMPQMLCCGP
ncbi:hypothetical protein HPP92_013698 [Vanilla planifolia]|uniref:Uncharacterized protein n=1 Tax=Vanilla planifolia TaxID=51239 RepID=A0A835UWQ6_VANPL|nr:hypothetical protein HPP92_013698 [Vanilla planifolia]